jgi:hypothetical protein
MKTAALLLGSCFAVVSAGASAATFVIVNGDDPGEGLNDPTPVAPLASNPGTTLGAQRLNLIQAAADYWGARLDSAVPIHIFADFDVGSCNTTSAVLTYGAAIVHRTVVVEPDEYWVTSALANALLAADASPDNAAFADYDILLEINPDIDSGCDGNNGWSYETTTAVPVPANKLPLMSLAMHEIAHGLGFTLLTDTNTGAYAESTQGFTYPDVWALWLADLSVGPDGTRWIEMDQVGDGDQRRYDSARNEPFLVWSGAHVNAAAQGWLDPKPTAILHPPAPVSEIEFRKGLTLGPRPPLAGTLRDQVVAVDDGVDPIGDGCQPLLNQAALAGRIALFDRNDCTFAAKGLAAQAAGAIAALIANNSDAGLPPMGGTEPALLIPTLGISQADGALLRANPGAALSIGYDANDRAGTTGGLVRMYAQADVLDSEVASHFSTSMSPTPLMVQRLYEVRTFQSDLTFPLLRDIGWPVLVAPNEAPYVDAAATFAAAVDQPSMLAEVWFGDPDAEDSPLSLRFQVSAGSILLDTADGVTTSGSPSNDATVTAPRSLLLPYVARGAVRFLSNAGDSSDVTLTVTIDDNGNTGAGGAHTASDSATIDVGTGNAPTANAQALVVGEDTVLDIHLGGSDPNSDRLSFAIASGPSHGTLSGAFGALVYRPAANYSGPDGFTFVALDGVLVSPPASVDITVNGSNDAPVAGTLADRSLPADVAANFSIATGFTDPELDPLTYSATGLPSSLTLNFATGAITGTPLQAEAGAHPVQVTASDGALTASANFTINIGGIRVFANGFEQ